MTQPQEPIDVLVAAVKARDLATVRELVEARPILATMCTAAGEEPLRTAIYVRERPIIDYLLTKPGGDCFFAACALGRVDAVRAVLASNPGAAKVMDDFSPLGLAAYFGQDEVAGLLLAAGADPNQPAANPMRVTPLHSAVAGRHEALALRLLDAGADPNARQSGGYTPLHQAAHAGLAELVERLLAAGADRAAATDDGRTALDFATADGHAAIAAMLAG